MSSINKVILIGRLGKDVEVRNTQDGNEIINFSLATNESWRDKQTGELKDKTEWHKIVIFNEKIGEIAKKYLKKGSGVYIEGQLQTREWTTKEGQKKYTTEVVMQRFKGDLRLLDKKETSANDSFDNYNVLKESKPDNSNNSFDSFEDDIPF